MVIDKIKKRIEYDGENDNQEKEHRSDIPVGMWVKCSKCKEILYKDDLHKNYSICPNCGNHFRLSSRRRIDQIIDKGTFEEFNLSNESSNPLDMEDYVKKLDALREKTGLDEAVKCGIGKINSEKVVICVMDSNFMMGSMGKVVGEKITYSIEKAIQLHLPVIIFCASGGARMQEGYISVLTDPTYGGVTASFASLGDIILAEPGAMIGFAGPRVIKQTIGEDLPEGFQTAEFLLEHGFVDKVVNRKEMKETLYKLLLLHKGGKADGK